MGWMDAPEVDPQGKWASAPEAEQPKYAPNGVPMNAAAKAEVIALAKMGMGNSPSPRQAGIDASTEAGMRENSVSGIAAQAGVGTQSGIANALGFPVDAVTGAINGMGQLTGGWGPIENPVGGSAMFDSMFKPLNSSIPEPATKAERYARRIGEEVGSAATMAPIGAPMAMAKGSLAPYAVA